MGNLAPGAYGTVMARFKVLCRDKNMGQRPCPCPVISRSIPARLKKWLRPTNTAQAHDKEIKDAAERIMRGAATWGDRIRGLLDVLQSLPNEFPEHQRLDAKSCLRDGGTCTSFANLAAALCRAMGIACRQKLCCIPVSYPYEVHWIVEVFCPRHGWVNLEPSQTAYPYAATACVDLWLLDIQEENTRKKAKGIAGYYWTGSSHSKLLVGGATNPKDGELPQYNKCGLPQVSQIPRKSINKIFAAAKLCWKPLMKEGVSCLVEGSKQTVSLSIPNLFQ